MGGFRLLHNFGFQNTFLGANAGNTSMTGDSNTGVDAGALFRNMRGRDNAAFGLSALTSDTTGGGNSAFGQGALALNTTGGSNSAFGISALISNTTGAFNSAFGISALGSLTSGDSNTAIGTGAGFNLTTGSNNIYLGNAGLASESNTIRIGLGQTAAFMAGINGATSASGTAVFVNGVGQLGTTTSSRRFKDEIADMGGKSDLLMKLRPVSFYYKPEYDDTHTRQYGLVAEEVAQVSPELVVFDKDGAPQTARYHFVNAMLLNEVQKQRQLIEEHQREGEEQRQLIEKQQSANEKQQSTIAL
jgi:hypothetical protein